MLIKVLNVIDLATRYSGAFLSLVPQLLNKIQFRRNWNQLKDLDNKTLDDDGETEWKKFIRPCIEIVAKVAEMQPIVILRLVVYTHVCCYELGKYEDNCIFFFLVWAMGGAVPVIWGCL